MMPIDPMRPELTQKDLTGVKIVPWIGEGLGRTFIFKDGAWRWLTQLRASDIPIIRRMEMAGRLTFSNDLVRRRYERERGRCDHETAVSANFHREFASETAAAFAMLWEVLAFYGAAIPTHVDPRPSTQAEALAATIRTMMEVTHGHQ